MEMDSESAAVSPSPLPVLVHHLGTGAEDSSQTLYSISTKTLTTAATIPELRDHRCFETPQGWVLAVDPSSLQTFLWRPQDSTRIPLPPLKEGLPLRCKCLLSDKPGAESGCKIYHELAGYELGMIEFDPAPRLGGLDIDMVDLPSHIPMASTYLVESRGDLFLAVVFFDGDNFHKVAELRVYRMDRSSETKPAWREVDRIGDDRVFLLGGDRIGISNFGASCSAHGGLKGNCVYFLNHLATTENFLHVFDLVDGTQQVQRPFRDMGFPLPPRPPFWLLPTE